MPTVVTDIQRTGPKLRDAFGQLGVATIHEAQNRTGLLSSDIRPIHPQDAIVGSAVTCSVAPGDNWMIHFAIEQCQEGDILVVAPTSPCTDGFIGELLAEAMKYRGVRGLVIDAGVRDTADLREIGFPVWARAISAQGTVKQTLGDVNLPLVCGGQLISPGDLVAADSDGIVVVAQQKCEMVLAEATKRHRDEIQKRREIVAGASTLDLYDLRQRAVESGLEFIPQVNL
ncbi:4-carboxy-4-hydroxy-2-oxoadipate aldolase/oxaloacetate decarboxylase [Cognatishimia maritima]|uniref:4-hydroxy-4-methyl-2-oxoglutarate aldolase n=1 Tax=Cognatishimia maritima TaxID=870908 RepID=A0A1M5VZS2_9RHOB|nr:4-carboxy-4-hydroxy-2-oxoadipate aldolase/oxaloacetate decarboxylase [Cognatishimia maritima]SHH80474.1 4-carboxy-4-hydroxy-2-oxoadipate aldolase [Cognatishimia maritima]